MRPLEVAILALITIAWLLRFIVPRYPKLTNLSLITSGLAVLVMVAQWVVEGARWQMVPAYVFVTILAIAAFLGGRREAALRPPGRWWRAALRWTEVGLAWLALVIAIALPLLFPVNILPAPTGPYRIGTTTTHLIDQSRGEPFTADPRDRRELEVTAWYPARAGGRVVRLWGDQEPVARELALGFKLPSFFFSHLELSPSHARAGAPVAEGGPFPTLVFSHGYGVGFAAQNSTLFEELASRGFVVLAVNHPHEGLITTNADGALVRGDQVQITKFINEVSNQIPLIIQSSRATDPAKSDAAFHAALDKMPINRTSLALWAADLRFVMDRVPALAASGPLAGALDPGRMGMVGMSFGGAAAIQACAEDPRCRAAVNLDGGTFGDVARTGTSRPILYLNSDHPDLRNVNRVAFRRSGPGSSYLNLKGAQHLDFSDLNLITPVLRWIGALGPIGGENAAQQVRAAVVPFVQNHVADKPGQRASQR